MDMFGHALPPIPETGWKPPTIFPRLDAAKAICIDCETYDPQLLTHGPGWGRGVGHIVGIAVGTDDGHRWYFPMRHTVGAGNLPPEAVLDWAREEFGRAHQPKLFANSQYDLGWLAQEGVTVAGDIIDVQIAEPLIDEHAKSYSLDSLAEKYLGEGKVDEALYDWCYKAYGGKPGRPQAGNIYRAPPCLVGPYAEGDVDLPFRVWEHQRRSIHVQELEQVFEIESRIPRILVGMRMRGIRVDVDGAVRLRDELILKRDALKKSAGVSDIWAADAIARALKGMDYPLTPTGKPSFTADWLARHAPQIAQADRKSTRLNSSHT